MGIFSALGSIVGSVVPVVGTAIGGAIGGAIDGSMASDDQQSAVNANSAEAQRIAKEERDRAYANNAPYRNVGTYGVNELGRRMGYGGTPQLTREQIRQNILSGKSSTGYNSPPIQQNKFNNLPTQWIDEFGQQQYTPQQMNNARIALNLDGDNSPEANARVNAFLSSQQTNTNGNNSNLSQEEIDRMTEEQYARQQADLEAQKSDPTFGSFLHEYSFNDFQKDPTYDFMKGEGINAIQNSAVGNGSLNSGATLRALQKYGTNFANTQYDTYKNRYDNDITNFYNRLTGLTGIGSQANATDRGITSSANQSIQNANNNNTNAQLLNNQQQASVMGQFAQSGVPQQIGNAVVGAYNNWQNGNNVMNNWQSGLASGGIYG